MIAAFRVMSNRPLPPCETAPGDSLTDRALSPAAGADLLHRIAQGEAAALESLYQLCGDRFYSMARRMIHDEGAAREIVQDCFVRIWQRAAHYDVQRSQPFTWAAMILRGLCLDHLRRIGRRLPPSPGDGAWETPCPQLPLADLHLHETLHLVRRSLASLTLAEQEAITASLFEPASCLDLAQRWQVPPGSVKTRIHRAMQKLRSLLRSQLES